LPASAAPGSLAKKNPWLRRVKFAIRVTVIALVIWGVWYTIQKAFHSLREEQITARDLIRLDAAWLAAAGVLYVAGQWPAYWFWRQALRAMGQHPEFWPTARAYFIGHLGKYVPGKAMVVVLRTSLVRGRGVDATTAAICVFVETLTLMAVGACFASALLATLYRQYSGLLFLGVLMMLGAGVPTLPPIFRRLVKLLQVQRLNPQIELSLQGIDWRLMLRGWVSMSIGWCLMGLSLWAVLQSLPEELVRTTPQLEHIPLIAASVALAMVAGFLSLIPGGLGVRELVVIPLLAPVFGDVGAIVSAVLLRLIWLLAELAMSGILYVLAPAPAQHQESPATLNTSSRA
jgi:uncharacterized membrane protein YbhN (UPF0104 family)